MHFHEQPSIHCVSTNNQFLLQISQAVTTFKKPRIGGINSTKMTLGDRIQVLRKEKRLTQAGLASNIGVSIAQLTRYETQDVLPNADALKRMAMCFGITIDFLVNGTTAQKAESAISDAKLLGLFKQVELLADEDRKVIFKLIEAFTIKKQLEHMLKQ